MARVDSSVLDLAGLPQIPGAIFERAHGLVSDSLLELWSVPCRPVSIKFIPLSSTRAILQQSFSPARIRLRSRLHRALIAEFCPIGALEQDIVADIARLTWRQQNLATFRIAEPAKERHQKIQYDKVPGTPLLLLDDIDPAAAREGYRAAEKQARQELGDIYQSISANPRQSRV